MRRVRRRMYVYSAEMTSLRSRQVIGRYFAWMSGLPQCHCAVSPSVARGSQQRFSQRTWRVDRQTVDGLTIQLAEMPAIASDQRIASFPERRRQHGTIFLRQRRRAFCGQLMVPKRYDFDLPEHGLEHRDTCLALGLEISPRFGDHVKIRAQHVSSFAQQLQQFANRAIGLGRGEQDVGIQKNTHADSASDCDRTCAARNPALMTRRAASCSCGRALRQVRLRIRRTPGHA